jgi:ArsR family transcriptional regulator
MEELIGLFKALSDETRVRIIKLLEHGELCVCYIQAALVMGQPKVSFHLAVLKKAGLLKDRREGKWVHYSFDESEMFKRFLLLSVTEKVSEKEIELDKARLEAFLRNEAEGKNVVPLSISGSSCCQD